MTKTPTATSVSLVDISDLRGNQAGQLAAFHSTLALGIGGLDPLSTAGQVALRLSCANGSRFVRRLGGTTYRYAIWAVVDPRDGELLLLRTGDDRGRWINAACRPWNGGCRL